MSPLQKIAMGLVIVVGSAGFPAHPHPSWRHFDLLPDPIGWVLVVAGLLALRRLHSAFDTATWLAVVAGVISLPLWVPELAHHIDASGSWALSMPQTVCCLLVCLSIRRLGAAEQPPDLYAARRFGLLAWGFGLVAVLPVIALGGHVQRLENLTLLVSMLVNVAFIVYLFLVNRRPWLGGPGPREAAPSAEKHEGRPPSS
jgi:hypothetical protein